MLKHKLRILKMKICLSYLVYSINSSLVNNTIFCFNYSIICFHFFFLILCFMFSNSYLYERSSIIVRNIFMEIYLYLLFSQSDDDHYMRSKYYKIKNK